MQSGMKDRRAPAAGRTAVLQPSKPRHTPSPPSHTRLVGLPPSTAARVLLAKGGPCAPLSPRGPPLRGLTSTGAGMCPGHPKSHPHRGSRSPRSPGQASPFILDFPVLTTLFPSSYLVTCHLPDRGVLLTPLHSAPSPTGFLPWDSPD